MHILLIKPSTEGGVRIPQGLIYLASAIKHSGHTVTIHDEALMIDPEKSLQEILNYDADIIGLSVYTEPWNLRRAQLISKTLKAKSKTKTVIWGGWHPSLYPRACIKNEHVDIIIRGPGEKIICELLNALQQGSSLKDIPGLLYKENGAVLETGPICLDPHYLYPPLDFNLINTDAYLKHHDQGTGILQYVTSRGCHGKCTFCCMAYLFKGLVTRKPQNLIVTELSYLVRHHPVRSIHFSDDNAFRNDREACELSDIVSKVTGGKGMPWRCAVRIDTLSRLSDKAYQVLRESGCKGFSIGIESGTDRVLKLMRKGFRLSSVHDGLKRLADHGIDHNLFFFMVGFPGETTEESPKTLALARKIRLMFPKSDLIIYVYRPWAPDPSLVFCSPLSTCTDAVDALEKYYAEYVRPFRIAGKKVSLLNHYLIASRQPQDKQTVKQSSLRWLYRKLALTRVKYNIFSFPFEYYLSKQMKRFRKKA